jgi:hypothetical protein
MIQQRNIAYKEAIESVPHIGIQRSRAARAFQQELRRDLIQARWNMRAARNRARGANVGVQLACTLAFLVAQGEFDGAMDRLPTFIPLRLALRNASWGL